MNVFLVRKVKRALVRVKNISLIGYRGSGKTTVGTRLAERLGWSYVDSDQKVVDKTGRTIRELFDKQGEMAFREIESEVIMELADCQQHVISLGGGVVLKESNRDCIQKFSYVVWLQASVNTLCDRIAADPASATMRPDLTPEGGRKEVIRILKERHSYYESCADLEIDTTGHEADSVVDMICSHV